jgi:glycosyltransferase involved in cell wall biosynthesis
MGKRILSKLDLSFVIPAYNEECSIENALGTLDETVKSKKLQYEIVVVDDGSEDKTLSKAMTYASKNGHVKVVSYTKNFGKGYAVKKGFMQAVGEVVIFVDSDLDINLKGISRYVEALQHGDIVIASKWHPQSVVEMPLVRRLLSRGFNLLVRLLTGARLRDTQVGLKVLKKSALKKVFPRLSVKRYAFDVELLIVANLYGLKVVEMPVDLQVQTLFSLREMWRMFMDLLGIAYRLRVTHWYGKPLAYNDDPVEVADY